MEEEKGVLVTILLLLWASTAGTGEAERLDNAAVIELHKLGLSAEVIILKIETSECDFDVSVAGLKQLKRAGVPDDVIAAMLRKSSGKAPRPVVARGGREKGTRPRETGTRPRETGTRPQETNLYYQKSGNDLIRVAPVKGEMEIPGGMKSAFSFGFKKYKSKLVFPGTRADLRIEEWRPKFQLHIEKGSALVAEDAVLAKVRVNNRKSQRELTISEISAGGGKTGVPEDDRLPVSIERLSPGVYVMQSEEALGTGEFVFSFGQQRAYAFGIDGSD